MFQQRNILFKNKDFFWERSSWYDFLGEGLLFIYYLRQSYISQVHWPYTVAYTIDCVCSKMLNHGLFLSLFKLIPCPIHWIVYLLAYLNFIFEFSSSFSTAQPKTAVLKNIWWFLNWARSVNLELVTGFQNKHNRRLTFSEPMMTC